jgi:FkbM family methyltransferase
MSDEQRARFACWLNTSSIPFPESIRMWLLDLVVGRELTQTELKAIDSKLFLDLADSAQSHIFLDGKWETDFSNWAAFFASRSRIIFDVGGHIGYFTALMAKQSPDATLHTFEPNPNVRAILKRNVEVNRLPVTLEPFAIADTDGTATFFLPHRLRLGTGRMGNLLYSDEQITVETTSLDRYCAQNNIAYVDLIKMDIEGGEARALPGMREGLHAERYGVLLAEFHQTIMSPEETESVLNELESAGYYLYEVHPDRLARARSITTSYFCAMSPSVYRNLGSPENNFRLPVKTKLPYPLT